MGRKRNIRAQDRKAVSGLLHIDPGRVTCGQALKWRLWTEQEGRDLYTGLAIPIDELLGAHADQTDIDHIIPRSRGGTDAYTNEVVTFKRLNRTKAARTPYEWMLGSGVAHLWLAFCDRVLAANISVEKKKNLLHCDGVGSDTLLT